MKMPKKPPGLAQLVDCLRDPERLQAVLETVPEPFAEGKYPHWDDLRYHEPPGDLSLGEWWFGLKFCRKGMSRVVPLRDNRGEQFGYVLTDPILERLHEIDMGCGGRIQAPAQITNPDMRDRYIINSLIEEAVASSQLEGARTTRAVAKEMIRAGREPRDRSERMILNNFLTMKRIGEVRGSPLTKSLVLELHRIVTDDTLEDPSGAGRLCRTGERRLVVDHAGEVFHTPPDAGELGARMEAMCRFANGESPGGFIHPAIRSVILHFWLAYDHPFLDGNGRTARALFYWSMLHQGFWLFEFISISSAIRKSRAEYDRAFLHVETDENDMTYFLLHQLEVIHRAIQELHSYIERKADQLRGLEAKLRGIAVLNHRQQALIAHALRHPEQTYSFESHRMSHGVVYETARTDLVDLERRGLLRAKKVGRKMQFTPAGGLERRLARLR